MRHQVISWLAMAWGRAVEHANGAACETICSEVGGEVVWGLAAAHTIKSLLQCVFGHWRYVMVTQTLVS
jgi:hypothetical protein